MRPNILLITSDQQHWNTLGCRNPEVKTPNLDRLAAQGLLFERAYCPNPTCTPTRASLITGQYPSTHGAWSLGTKLEETRPTIGATLQSVGYDCALIGKAHFQPLRSTAAHISLESYPILRDLDFWRAFSGPFYGFNHIEITRPHADETHVGQHYAIWMEENGLPDWAEHFRSQCMEWDFDPGHPHAPQLHRWTLPEQFHSNTWITDRACARIDQARADDQPFFLWASYFDPHPPYLVPAPWDTMYDPAEVTVPEVTPGEHDRNPPHFGLTQQPDPDFSAWQETPMGNHGFHSHLQDRDELAKDIAVYYGMISFMDQQIGRLLDHLDAQGLTENTLVVFTTDHGHFFGHHGMIAKGAFHYEDAIKVPLLARWPGHLPAGQATTALQSLVDLPATFLAAAGMAVPTWMQGVNQLPVWTGEQATARDHVLVEFRHQPTALHLRTYVDERYKLTTYYRQDYGELFDLVEDPGEVRNLWDDPAAAALKARLLKALIDAEMGREPMPMPRIAGA